MNELEKQILKDVVAALKQNDLSNDVDIVPCAEAIDGLLEFSQSLQPVPSLQYDLKK